LNALVSLSVMKGLLVLRSRSVLGCGMVGVDNDAGWELQRLDECERAPRNSVEEALGPVTDDDRVDHHSILVDEVVGGEVVDQLAAPADQQVTPVLLFELPN